MGSANWDVYRLCALAPSAVHTGLWVSSWTYRVQDSLVCKHLEEHLVFHLVKLCVRKPKGLETSQNSQLWALGSQKAAWFQACSVEVSCELCSV